MYKVTVALLGLALIAICNYSADYYCLVVSRYTSLVAAYRHFVIVVVIVVIIVVETCLDVNTHKRLQNYMCVSIS